MVPTYQLTGEKFHILGRGTSYTACLTDNCSRDDLSELIGKDLLLNDVPRKILGVESFAIFNLSKGTMIGILVEGYD